MASFPLSRTKKERSLSGAIRRNKSRRNLQKAADTLPLTRCDDDATLFTVTVTIGKQPFQLVVDTASTDLWVTAQECEDCIQTPNRYDVTDATPLYENVLENFYDSISAGNQLTGSLYQDRVSFADNTIQIPAQGFAVIDRMEAYFDPPCANQWDGYLGLGPLSQGITGEGQVEHFETIVKHLHDALPRPIFALRLTDDDESSQLLLGGIDRTLYVGCLVWHDVQPMDMNVDILWNLKVQSSSVGGVELPDVDTAVLDSSAAFSLGPSNAVAAFVKQTKGWFCGARDEFTGIIQDVGCDDAYFEFGFGPCDSPVDALEVTVDGVSYSMTEWVTPLGEDDAVDMDSDVDEWCLLTLLPDDNLSGWLLGQQFFEDYFVAFDFQQNKIGLAPTRADENDGSSLCPDDELLDIHNTVPTSSSATPTLAPSNGEQSNTNSPSPAPFQGGEDQESSVPPVSFGSVWPTEAPAPGDSEIASPAPIPTKSPSRGPTAAPYRALIPPHSSPRSPTPSPYSSPDGSENAATIVPFVVGAALLALLVFCATKRRQSQGRYRRTGWSDGYTMGGDLELRDIS